MGEKILAMIVSALIKHIPEYCAALGRWIVDKLKSIKSTKAQKEAKENLDKVDANPESTAKEKAEAYEKYINS